MIFLKYSLHLNIKWLPLFQWYTYLSIMCPHIVNRRFPGPELLTCPLHLIISVFQILICCSTNMLYKMVNSAIGLNNLLIYRYLIFFNIIYKYLLKLYLDLLYLSFSSTMGEGLRLAASLLLGPAAVFVQCI